ncbi:ATP-binding cassette domain-containing protein [Conexibacter arvalis]|uniref:ABC-type Mn2+/Zn2+ transport system ATPase subunit n=1 Tax=Conexibacter arvalis TaxID=912552 RepID=A0A840I7C7_9ACTN|nr:ATP-binding cassette domain-containing protein [Conexibacter arvalis]MBB4660796.1 ABC-type Mn2+/Zn2+ transport system ATPase subunit [Conexibacter arvalis]
MSALLSIERVTHRYSAKAIGLDDASLQLDAGGFVAVWGPPRSGRTTLLEVAAGLLDPDEGAVRFDGGPPRVALGREAGIAWAVDGPEAFIAAAGERVIDQVAWPALRLTSRWRARDRADELLMRCGVDGLADAEPWQLSHAERVRVLLARALVNRPRLVLLDEPAAGSPKPERERLWELLRALVREEGLAVLATDHDGHAFAGARALTLQRGALRGEPTRPPAPVVSLDARRAGPGTA